MTLSALLRRVRLFRGILAQFMIVWSFAVPWAMGSAVATGSVDFCTEEVLDAALRSGGVITFQCSGVIHVTHPKVITRDTTLDATGQRVTLSGKPPIFEVQPGVNLSLKNLLIVTPGLEGANRLPATGYPPPPNEWLFVGLGGAALVAVSLLMAGFTQWQARQRRTGIS